MHVTLLLPEHCSAASATLALELLHAANQFSGSASPLFEVVSVSKDGQPVPTSAGQRLLADRAMEDIRQTDLVLIPGYLFSLAQALPTFPQYRDWLLRQHQQGAVLASMCNATFLLADTGLLNGRSATTHWAFTEPFRRRYPQVRLREDNLLCDEGSLITAGGATAAMDLMLHLVRRFASLELAQTCSRYLLVDSRQCGQSAYVMWTLPKQHKDPAILKVQNWLDEHYHEPLRVDELAARFGFGERNFKRRFRDATGFAPLAYLQTLRLEQAKQLMENTRMTLESITLAVGYEDPNSFRRLFQDRVGLSPAEYRRKFRPLPATAPL